MISYIFFTIFLSMLKVLFVSSSQRTANYPLEKCKVEKELLMVTRDNDSLFGEEMRQTYPNMVNLNKIKLSDVTNLLAKRRERIFWINLSDPQKDRIWFKKFLKQRNRFRHKCLVVVHMWTYTLLPLHVENDKRIKLDQMGIISLAEAKLLDGIMIYTKSIASRARHHGVKAPFVRIWPKFIEVKSMNIHPPEGKYIFTSAGSHGAARSRDIPTLVEALKLLAEDEVIIKLVIAMDDSAGKKLPKFCKGLIQCETVTLNRFEHREFIKNSFLVVVPIVGRERNLERGTTVVVEALAHGKLVISTMLPNSFEGYIKDGRNGYLVPPGDATAIASRISEIRKNNTLREKMEEYAMASSHQFSDIYGDGLNYICKLCEKFL